MGNSGSHESSLKDIYDREGEDAFIKAVWDGIIKPEDYELLREKPFNFDCLALEGGGVKGVAYAGAAKVLEDVGILKKIKRFAGTSAGAYMAMQLAIGMSVDEIFKINGIPNLQDAYYDSGPWALPINIMKDYGWQSGQKLQARIEDDLERHLGDRDATFLDLYNKRGIELCIVVTNLNSRLVEYAHPKTMPTLKIAAAVRTSMSLPILFAPTAVKDHGIQRFFVDGGLLENYPIAVFDGWYLSMKKDDDFINKINADPSTKFTGYNPKTLGMVVFSYGETQANAEEFLRRYGDHILEGRPDSKLSKERDHTRKWENLKKKHDAEVAARELVKYVAKEFNELADDKGLFSFQDFKIIMGKIESDPEMSKYLHLVTGDERGLRPLWDTFQEMDINKDNQLSLVELLMHLTKKGIYLRYDLESRHPRSIDDLTAYIFSMIEVMQTYISELQEKPQDADRTVGIYTDYITTTDFDMSLDDKAYMCQMGYRACVNFLRDYKHL